MKPLYHKPRELRIYWGPSGWKKKKPRTLTPTILLVIGLSS